MNSDVIKAHVEKNTKKASEIGSQNWTWDVGFAIPAPRGATPEDLVVIEEQLLKLGWSFERVIIRGHVNHVLFP